MKHSIYILSISAFFTFQTHQQGAEIQKIEEIVKEEAKKVVNEFTFLMALGDIQKIIGQNNKLKKFIPSDGYSNCVYYIPNTSKGIPFSIPLGHWYKLTLRQISFYKGKPWNFSFNLIKRDGLVEKKGDFEKMEVFIKNLLINKFETKIINEKKIPKDVLNQYIIKNNKTIAKPYESLNQKGSPVIAEWIVGIDQSKIKKSVLVTKKPLWIDVSFTNLKVYEEILKIDASEVF